MKEHCENEELEKSMDILLDSSSNDQEYILNKSQDGFDYQSTMIETKKIDRRHELRKELKLLKLANMKIKKQLRLSMRVRFLNGVRLEDEIVQLNTMLVRLKSAVIDKDTVPNEIVSDDKFINPEKTKFQSTSINSIDGQKTSSIYNRPVQKQKDAYRFYCDICEFRSVKRTPFEIHMRRHANNRPYVCVHCARRFITPHDLKLHAARHVAHREFSCNQCEYRKYRADRLLNHKEKHIGLETYKCDQPRLKTVERLKIVAHRKSRDELSDIKPCLACSISKNPLHIDVEKSNGEDITIDSSSNKDIDEKGSVLLKHISDSSIGRSRLCTPRHTCSKPWTCHFCGNSFKKRESLTKHLRTHTGERPHSCDQCQYSAATRHTLLIHKRTHSGEKPYACTHCEFRCTTKGYLKIHLNKHEGIKPYACTECDYRSVDSCKLSAHMKVKHSDEKPYSCNRCPFTTKLASRLRQHTIRHDAGKLVCGHCGQGFKIRASLVEHEGTHTGDQPFKCTQCCVEKRFTLESTYKRHLARHKLKFECPLCPYKTGLRKDLLRHSKLHIERGEKCAICEKRYINNDLMIRHMQIKHPNYLSNSTNPTHHTNSNKTPNAQIYPTDTTDSKWTAILVKREGSKNIAVSTPDEINRTNRSSIIACNVSATVCKTEDPTVQITTRDNSTINLITNTLPIAHLNFTNPDNLADAKNSVELPISVTLSNSTNPLKTECIQPPSFQQLNPTILNIPQSYTQRFHQIKEDVDTDDASNSAKENTDNPQMIEFPNPTEDTFYWGES